MLKKWLKEKRLQKFRECQRIIDWEKFCKEVKEKDEVLINGVRHTVKKRTLIFNNFTHPVLFIQNSYNEKDTKVIDLNPALVPTHTNYTFISS